MANIKKVDKKETGLVIFNDGDDQKKRDFFVTGETVDGILEKIEKEVLGHVPDTSTAKGRNAIKANVTIATNYKTFLETTGKELSAEQKLIPGKIDSTRNKIKKFMVDLQIKARQSLTDWEDEQKVIAAKKLADLEAEKLVAEFDRDYEIGHFMDKEFDRDILDAKKEAEEAAVKLAEQQKKDQIAHDQKVAEDARIEAEQKAETERLRLEKEKQNAIDLAAKLKQQVIDDKAKAEQDARDSKARERLLSEQAAQRKIDQEWLDYISEAYRINAEIDLKKQAEYEAAQAESKRKRDVEAARQAEIQRQSDEAARVKSEAEKREADKEYQGKVHSAILAVLVKHDISVKDGKKMIALAARELLPKLSINY